MMNLHPIYLECVKVSEDAFFNQLMHKNCSIFVQKVPGAHNSIGERRRRRFDKSRESINRVTVLFGAYIMKIKRKSASETRALRVKIRKLFRNC